MGMILNNESESFDPKKIHQEAFEKSIKDQIREIQEHLSVLEALAIHRCKFHNNIEARYWAELDDNKAGFWVCWTCAKEIIETQGEVYDKKTGLYILREQDGRIHKYPKSQKQRRTEGIIAEFPTVFK